MSRTRTTLAGIAGCVLLATALAGCSLSPANSAGGTSSDQPSSGTAPGQSSSSASASPTPTTPPVTFEANVDDRATKVKVDTRVAVKVSDGTLSKVKLSYSGVDSKGQKEKGTVKGALSKDRRTWTAQDRLEPSAKYSLAMTGRNADDKPATQTSTFSTQKLSLDSQTFPSIYPLKDSTVGIGMPVVLTFDVPVKDKATFEKNLHVTSKPAQKGTWNWLSDREVRFRPQKYWKSGTKVEVEADLNGLAAGNGIYGQQSVRTSFKVGRSMITKINLATDVATVYENGKKVRTIYVSGGKPGWQTRSGTKLIMAKEYNKKMTSEMIGAEEDYSLVAQYALRVTNSGEFLHSAPWNAAHFGRRNASHGCVGMSTADSAWLYNRSLIGDPVVTTGTGRGLEQGNGYADWNVSFAQYAKGSAL